MSDETQNQTPTSTTTSNKNGPMRVVILNQYYVPDVASTGHLLFELAENIASQGAEVKVITCRPSYGPKETWQKCPRKEFKHGVKVHRMFTTRYSKDSIIGRIINSITFLLPLAFLHVLPRMRGEVFLYTTNPPYLGFVGGFISLVRRHKYVVLLHDSYPELAVWVGKIRSGGFIDKFWKFCNKIMYRRAKQIIVLSEAAKRLVVENYGPDPDRVHVIPNWADPKELEPKPKEESSFAKEYGLVEPFTLLYSGNLGLYYEFDMILDAAERLLNKNFRLVFTGAGGQRNAIEKKIKEKNLTNTLLLPYTPQEQFNDALCGCDALLVTIAKGIDGISFPSKLYTSMSVGRPIVAFSSPNSELRLKVETNQVGYWVELGDTDGLVDSISYMMEHKEETKAMGDLARQLLIDEYSIDVSGKKYFDVLKLGYKEN
ncbi:MAG: glycosyltransferase family 4 protein [Phycisphaerae bacterium]|jgi:glycosyltransferase involved in cell wall biosynthesis|nr:glycosyltransferase family 4 protein [Phycisphaerae bacterium]